jgi:outer membrane protein assembly factor BamD (BamD/ComL family)
MRRFILAFTVLWLAGLHLHAAGTAESGAFSAFSPAVNAFRERVWERAEKELGAFAAKYPKSTNVVEAILLQAEARLKLGRFSEAAALLNDHLDKAGERSDEYLYWIGQAKFQNANYSEAADVFGRLAAKFPQSARRLEAALDEVASNAKLKQWPRVIELLSDTNGAFQSAASLSPTNEMVYRGGLLLAEAQFTLKNYQAAEAALTTLTNQQAGAELNWQRQFLLSRVQLADDRAEEALQSTKELLVMAGTSKLRPESVSLQAKIFEQLNRTNDAIIAYQENLGGDVPVERQQQALFKIAELSMSLGKWDDATNKLEIFLRQNTNSPVEDVVLLTLGDLQFKKYLANSETNSLPDTTNFLRTAAAQFQTLVDKFPNSGLAGKALLNKGWSLWLGGDTAGSLNAFQSATRRLPFSGEQLVARFKWADAQSRLNDFAGAITNYNFVVNRAQPSSEPGVRELVEPALYQLLRASLDANDLKSASDALAKILDWYPNGFAAATGLLLTGQGFTLQQDTTRARELFGDFERRYPTNSLLPEVRLAIARTYEQEQGWTNAIQQYDDWLVSFTNNPALPRAEFYRAWAYYQLGNETNALTLFANFVSRFSTDALAPSAQWWIADHYFRLGGTNYVAAERNYQLVFQNSPTSDLAYQARMMAGRAAVARMGYADAITYYFTNLANDVSCPADLRARAMFAYGDVLVMQDSTNKTEDLQIALTVFSGILPKFGTNQQTVLAWGRIGDCYRLLGDVNPKLYYDKATNAYQQLIDSPLALVAARSQAKIGLGMLAEKQASLTTGDEQAALQTALLKQALENYRDVFLENNLRDGEMADPFWIKKARLEAARLSETLNEWTDAVGLYQKLEDLIPSSRTLFENKIEKIVKEHPEAGQN